MFMPTIGPPTIVSTNPLCSQNLWTMPRD